MLDAQQRTCEVSFLEYSHSCAIALTTNTRICFRPSLKRGARLGYMGHLISIFELLSENCSANDEYRALVESSFDSDRDDEKRLADWQQIQAPEVGELTNELHLQKTFLVNYSPILFIFYLYFIFHAGLFFLTI